MSIKKLVTINFFLNFVDCLSQVASGCSISLYPDKSVFNQQNQILIVIVATMATAVSC